MADERGHVDTEPLESIRVTGNVDLRAAAVAGDDRGHAVEQEIVCARQAFEARIAAGGFDVRVDVDEARRQYPAASVDNSLRIDVEISTQRGDPAVRDGHVAQEPGAARAVDDPRVANQDVGVLGQRNARHSKEKADDENGAHDPVELLHGIDLEAGWENTVFLVPAQV